MKNKLAAGFSLVELLIGVAIIGTIISLSVTSFAFYDRVILYAELNKLHAMCRYAQRCAMASNKKQVLTMDPVCGTYSFNGHKEVLHKAICFGFLASAQGPPSAPYSSIKSAITFKNKSIVFESNGIIQPGTVYLIDIKRSSMCALSSGISQVSLLRKYRYDKQWISI